MHVLQFHIMCFARFGDECMYIYRDLRYYPNAFHVLPLSLQFNSVQMIIGWDVGESFVTVAYGNIAWDAGHVGDDIITDIWDGFLRTPLNRAIGFLNQVDLTLGIRAPLLQNRQCRQLVAPLQVIPLQISAQNSCPPRAFLFFSFRFYRLRHYIRVNTRPRTYCYGIAGIGGRHGAVST